MKTDIAARVVHSEGPDCRTFARDPAARPVELQPVGHIAERPVERLPVGHVAGQPVAFAAEVPAEPVAGRLVGPTSRLPNGITRLCWRVPGNKRHVYARSDQRTRLITINATKQCSHT
jgi:hypothetical protein